MLLSDFIILETAKSSSLEDFSLNTSLPLAVLHLEALFNCLTFENLATMDRNIKIIYNKCIIA